MLRFLAVVLTSWPMLLSCSPDQQHQEDMKARQALLGPSFWRADVVDDSGGRAGSVLFCADSSVVELFSRPNAEINGQVCKETLVTTFKEDEYLGKCEAFGDLYGLSVNTTGDRKSDFTVRFALIPLQSSLGKVVQSRRYRRIGGCPAGWKLGDQGHGQGKPMSNILSGERYAP
ncbi:hypothetical protein [Caulobacter sp. LjRoot300]|uniref:hypothetical protein n=1 Tax=Caulobacter sp. LjRoot300 TaxID=3342321 RepID=UPI003ECF7734